MMFRPLLNCAKSQAGAPLRSGLTPLVANISNFGQWEEAGALTSEERASAIWERNLRDYKPPAKGAPVADSLARYIDVKNRADGAHPLK